ncbi:hypothetical protein [Spirosoma telluris]|uniref:hypothetical protein n=1 Tax=Spirosoma telluris TaxID=2183553 RepID=UPI0013142619
MSPIGTLQPYKYEFLTIWDKSDVVLISSYTFKHRSMNQPAIPILDPGTFVDQFVATEAREHARHLHASADSHFPASRFFTLMRIEDFACQITFPIPISRSFHYDFMLLTRGAIQRTYGLESYTIGPGMFSAYRAGDIVSTDSCSADATGFYGLFDAEFVLTTLKNPHALNELSFFQPDANPLVPLDTDTESDWLAQLGRMERALKSQRMDSQAYISSLFYAFCWMCSSNMVSGNSPVNYRHLLGLRPTSGNY